MDNKMLIMLKQGKSYLFTAIPAVLIFITTIGAMVYNIYCFVTADEPKILLTGIAIVLLIMAVFMVIKSFAVMKETKKD